MKNKIRELTRPDFKTLYKDTIIKCYIHIKIEK